MSDLSTLHVQSMDRINTAFFEDGDGLRAVAERTRMVDEVVRGLFQSEFEGENGITAVAVGGYGRSQLFPFSDVDLLFLVAREADAERFKDRISTLLTNLWDAHLRVSQSVRTPAECGRAARDNAELHVSLLDARYLSGDRALFDDLAKNRLPRFFVRERKWLIASLVEMAEKRHQSFDQTIYHLEPDIKEGPGGLRDFQLACWISQLARVGPDRVPETEEGLPSEAASALLEAKRFLFAVRSYLHYFNGRDNNRLAFDLQESIASDGAGKAFEEFSSAADWMRQYYRSARTIHRLALRMIDEHGTPRNSLFTLLRDRTKRFSNNDFSVTRGQIYLRIPNAVEAEPEAQLRLFRFVARHGLPLAASAEQKVAAAAGALQSYVESSPGVWKSVCDILKQPHAYEALTVMHETGALFAVFPELRAIDCLVLRDFYHRYTVDEHTFLTIQTIHGLGEHPDEDSKRFAAVLAEIDRPEILFFALLYHDAGRRDGDPDFTARSEELAQAALERLGAPSADIKAVLFLVREQSLMSYTATKRDTSDPETIDELARATESIDNLRLLAMLTYADTTAVNPDAMTPWRKELLWRLYLAVFNRLTGDAEDRRIHVDEGRDPVMAAADSGDREQLAGFLEGFPERYLRMHSPEEVVQHHQQSLLLSEKRSVVSTKRDGSVYLVEVLAHDRPFLFASICAVISGFGLSIERAEAFANSEGVVLDSFALTSGESRGGLDLDETELRSLRKSLRRVLDGREDPNESLRRRKPLFGQRGRTPVDPEVSFDNRTSSRATIFHVVAEDRVGLLYDLTSAISRHGCDIEVVLIETQGHKALDVFYVVGPEGKLSNERAKEFCDELLSACRQDS